MRYTTFIVTLENGHLDTSDPFAFPMPATTGTLDDCQTDAHIRRLGALERVYRHNTLQAARPQVPLRWMVAVELAMVTTTDVTKAWLQGEEGTLEATAEMRFRFMSPSIEEEELLRMRSTNGIG